MKSEVLSEISRNTYGDNYSLQVLSAGRTHFEVGMALAFRNYNTQHYSISDEHGLVFYWSQPEKSTNFPDIKPLPYVMDLVAAIDFAWNWLKTASYPAEPDHDGDNSKGFLISTGDGWGHIHNSAYSIVQVIPTWLMHGK